MTVMSYAVIRDLFEAIECARGGTQSPAQAAKLDLAQQMLLHGREFLDIGDYRAAWLRLSGAITAMENAGVPFRSDARHYLNELTLVIERAHG